MTPAVKPSHIFAGGLMGALMAAVLGSLVGIVMWSMGGIFLFGLDTEVSRLTAVAASGFLAGLLLVAPTMGMDLLNVDNREWRIALTLVGAVSGAIVGLILHTLPSAAPEVYADPVVYMWIRYDPHWRVFARGTLGAGMVLGAFLGVLIVVRAEIANSRTPDDEIRSGKFGNFYSARRGH